MLVIIVVFANMTLFAIDYIIVSSIVSIMFTVYIDSPNPRCGVQLFEDKVQLLNTWTLVIESLLFLDLVYSFPMKSVQIVGGNATSLYDYPWTALLRYHNERKQLESWGCSGSYIGWIFNNH